MLKNNAQEWQRQPETVKTDHVQVWSKTGLMITAQMTRSEARTLVINDRCFAINDQAIGFYDDAY